MTYFVVEASVDQQTRLTRLDAGDSIDIRYGYHGTDQLIVIGVTAFTAERAWDEPTVNVGVIRHLQGDILIGERKRRVHISTYPNYRAVIMRLLG